jgi:hypothetical protein
MFGTIRLELQRPLLAGRFRRYANIRIQVSQIAIEAIATDTVERGMHTCCAQTG